MSKSIVESVPVVETAAVEVKEADFSTVATTRAYALSRAQAGKASYKRSVVAFWEMGRALAHAQNLFAKLNRDKKRADKLEFGPWLAEFCEEAEVGPSYCYQSIKVFNFFRTSEECATFSINHAFAIACGKVNRLDNFGYLGVVKADLEESEIESFFGKATVETETESKATVETETESKATVAKTETESKATVETETETESKATVIAEVNHLIDQIHAIFLKVARISSTRGIDRKRLDMSKKELSALVKALKALPE